MHNITDDAMIDVFHAMKRGKEYINKIERQEARGGERRYTTPRHCETEATGAKAPFILQTYSFSGSNIWFRF